MYYAARNKRIDVFALLRVSDDYCGYINTYKYEFSDWSKIDRIDAKSYIKYNKKVTDVTHTFTIRYRPDLPERFVIRFSGRMYVPEQVVNINEDNKQLEILCKEGDEKVDIKST